jgi:hypothetical protein
MVSFTQNHSSQKHYGLWSTVIENKTRVNWSGILNDLKSTILLQITWALQELVGDVSARW